MLISHESFISGIQISQMIHRKSYLPFHLPLLLWPLLTLRGQIDIAAESSQAKQIEGASRGYKWGSGHTDVSSLSIKLSVIYDHVYIAVTYKFT